MVKSIEWTDHGVVILDQRLLPTEERYNTYQTVEEIAEAIETMVIRGAPAIGIAAAMGIAIEMNSVTSKERLEEEFGRICEVLQETRPTARNLSWAIERMRTRFSQNRELPLSEIQILLQQEALKIQQEDLEINRRIGWHGQKLLADGSTVLTHCNTGGLATGGYGTALGVVRAAVHEGKRLHVLADETRPYLQGARLTAWEMVKEGIPCTLITDSMSGAFMFEGKVDTVVVGADRIARNGEVANKIGTYVVAVLAHAHGIPFYVAAPLSTIDRSTPDGMAIPIEQRSPEEVTEIHGHPIAPTGIQVANPAFDVTPNHLVTAIITERGIAAPPFGESIQTLVERTTIE
jgi:methylthioribose-1-phosphate isomerase